MKVLSKAEMAETLAAAINLLNDIQATHELTMPQQNAMYNILAKVPAAAETFANNDHVSAKHLAK
jgi:hypothetical protein